MLQQFFHRAGTGLAVILAIAAVRDQPALLTGLDHVPVAVNDLERAGQTYRRLGFVLKPGTAHANGIENLHAKFRDGTEIELITAPAATDKLTKTYRQHLAAGDGPAFLALHAPDAEAMVRIVSADHPARTYIFFGQLNRSPTDRPEHFQHPNTAESLAGVWLASNDFSAELDLLKRAGVPVTAEPIGEPFNVTARVAQLGDDRLVMVPARFQRVPGRKIVGATVRVRDLDTAVAVLARGGVNVPPIARIQGGRRTILQPDQTHGWLLEFVERSRPK